MPRLSTALTLLVALGVGTPTASAAIFCVSDGPSLQNALTQAANNNDHDEIRLRAGTYTMSSGTTAFTFNSAEAFRLVMSGGWQTLGFNSCAFALTDPNLTVLSGATSRRVMSLATSNASSAADLEVRNLTIRDGNGPGFGGVRAESVGGSITLDRLIIRNNIGTGTDGTGGILVPATRRVDVTNNLLLDNSCVTGGCAARLASTTTNLWAIMFNFNTVARNRCPSNGCLMGGVHFGGSAATNISNNAFIANSAEQAHFANPDCHLRYNLIGGYRGTPTLVVGNLDPDDPGFVNPAGDNYRLRPDSPLLDAGEPFMDGSAIDLDGRARPNGAGDDIGAYELPYVILKDGFEASPF
jgi:hypothetical protein